MTTIVTFLLDRSGSMESIRDDTIGAFNAYTGELKKGDDITFSLLQFDTMSIDTTFKNLPINDVGRLDRDSFVPRGGTPLIDACVKTIRAVEKAVAEKPDAKVVICFQTDGQENSSREFTWAQLQDLIKEKTEAGWEFNFMGAGIDAYQQASRMGLGEMHTMSYDATDPIATASAFRERGATTAMYASGKVGDMTVSLGAKLAAGDKFDPSLKAKVSAKAAAARAAAPKKKAIVDEPNL